MIAVIIGIIAAAVACAIAYSWAGWMGVAALVAAALVAWCLWLALAWSFLRHRHLKSNRVRYQRFRLRLRLQPGPGTASVYELARRWSRTAAYQRSGRIRPSRSWWARGSDPFGHAVLLGRAQFGHRLWLPADEHGVIIAPPRTGKSALLASMVMRYPGPVVSTTTKPDIFSLTSGIRSRHGQIHVFNPQGIGRVASTFRWNPIAGCEDEATAIRRADAFAHAVSQKGVEEGSFWTIKASSYLRGLFHAAALVGGDMRMVQAWVLGTEIARAETILSEHGALGWAGQLAELRSEARRTAATVRMTMSRALQFMDDPKLAACVLPGPGDAVLDIGAFLRGRDTLYLIADSDGEDPPMAPLFACLAGEIHYLAEIAGQAMPGQRLDPPLLMALDEITQTCPVALPEWAADSGGKGIQLVSVVHGEAQLRERWGDNGAQTVLDTGGVLIFMRGITDTKTLDKASGLTGLALLREPRGDMNAKEQRPVMTCAMVSQMPPWRALVIRTGLAPVIAKTSRGWKELIYRQARRRGEHIAAIQAVPAAEPARPVLPAPRPSPNGHHPVPDTLPDLPPVTVADSDGFEAGGDGDYPWSPQ